jgi:2-C-methyl-D-erythritol 4-phosphate cytidylyltransferase
MNLGVIIAAGGIGNRMRTGVSKQLMNLAGMPVLAKTLSIFESLSEVSEIVIAIEESNILKCRLEMVDRFGFTKVSRIVPGGETRALSVKAALDAVCDETGLVAVHDGARPLFPGELLGAALTVLRREPETDGVVFALPVKDTIKESDPDSALIVATPDRSHLWAAQTPQVFRREALRKAYEQPIRTLTAATDDSSLVEAIGGRVKLIPGSPENIKITEPLDLILAAEILNRRKGKTAVPAEEDFSI